MKTILLVGILCSFIATLAAENIEPSLYLLLSTGPRYFSGADIDRQFDRSNKGGAKPDSGNYYSLDLDLALGYQSSGLFGVELGVQGGNTLLEVLPVNRAPGENPNTVRIADAGTALFSESIDLKSYYVMPTLRLLGPGIFSGPSFHTLGIGLEDTILQGSVVTEGQYSSTPYSALYDQRMTFSLAYRWEQMMGHHTSMGVEVAYHWADMVPNDTKGHQSLREDGTPLSLDFSGPSIKLTVAHWFVRPFNDPVGDRAAETKRRLREARRQARSHREDYRISEDLQAQGDSEMQKLHYELAAELYEEASNSDEGNRWAWQGLGNARYYLGEKREALEAYERAYPLSHGDGKLKALIDRLSTLNKASNTSR